MFKPNHQRFLKVKIKSLAAESKIIRDEEKKSYGILRCELHQHRVENVRRETRAALLAYSYLRGKTVSDVEMNPRGTYEAHVAYARAKEIVKKFGTTGAAEFFGQWVMAGASK